MAAAAALSLWEGQLDQLKSEKSKLEEEAGVLRDQVDAAKVQIESIASKIQNFTRDAEDSAIAIDDLKAQLAAKTADLDRQNQETSDARYGVLLTC